MKQYDLLIVGAGLFCAVVAQQARERGLHLIWVEHDLMDPRTVSRRDMRAKVTNYMRAIIQAEPTDESLIEFEDDITW